METRVCGSCNTEKAVTDFARKRGGWSSKCKECHNAYYREYWKNSPAYAKHKERVKKNRPRARAKKYGLTLAETKILADKYDGKCHLCRIADAVCIDHDHQTGKVRGMLCNKCNTGLGKLGDSIESLNRAIEYLSGSIPSVL